MHGPFSKILGAPGPLGPRIDAPANMNLPLSVQTQTRKEAFAISFTRAI